MKATRLESKVERGDEKYRENVKVEDARNTNLLIERLAEGRARVANRPLDERDVRYRQGSRE